MAGDLIRPADLVTERTSPVASEFMVVDNGVTVAKSKISDIGNTARPFSNQAEAEAGTSTTKTMTPLATKQAVTARIDVDIASKAQGDKADSAVQPARTITAGTGLTGGGDLSADRSVALSTGSQASLALADSAVQPARSISAGTGLTGGGSLGADRTISLSSGSQASLAKADSAVQPYPTSAGLAATNIPAGVHSIRTDGSAVEGDGAGGQFIDTNNGSHDTWPSGDGRTWYRAPPRSVNYYTGSDSILLSPPASYLVDGRNLPIIYPPNPPLGAYRQYHNAFATVGSNYVDRGLVDDPSAPAVIRSAAFGTFNGVRIISWNRNDAFGHCALMFSEYLERTAALGSDAAPWIGISSRQVAIDTNHNFYRSALPNTPAWATVGPGVDLEAAYPGVGQRIWDYATYATLVARSAYGTFVGRDAGANIVFGDNNTMLGYQSAAYMYAGGGNTILGVTAMQNSVFADNNVAIGYRAARDVIDASNSVFIGKDVALNVKNASASVFIGFNAGNGLSGAQDGVLMIANRADSGRGPLISGAFYDFTTRPYQGVGINVRPKDIRSNAALHVQWGNGDSDALVDIADPATEAAGILVSRNFDTGITVMTPATNKGRLYFGSPANPDRGGIMYDHALGRLYFRAGAVYRMQLGSGGVWVKDAMKSANPGAGTKELWYDPADGNTVKYAV